MFATNNKNQILSLIKATIKGPNEVHEKEPKLVIEAIKYNPEVLLYIKHDTITFEMAMIAVKQDGWIFDFLPKKIKNNQNLKDEIL